MPTARPASPATPLSRRTALTGAVAATGLLWSGCTTDQGPRRDRRERPPQDATATATAPEEDPDIAVTALALANERAVLDALTATVSRHPETRQRLAAAVEAHRAHVSLLSEATPPETMTQEPSESGTPSPDIAEAERVPRRRAAAVTRIVDLEDDLNMSHKRHAFAAQSGPFARLLASMAASAAQHAAELRTTEEPS